MLTEYEFTFLAMGTSVCIICIDTHVPNPQLIKSIEDEINGIEKKFSRFDQSSELSELNTKKQIQASEFFIKIFLLAQTLYKKTNTTFNSLLSPVFLGYEKDFNTHHTKFSAQEFSLAYNSDFEGIQYDKNKKTIQLQKGQKIDFGGFLKGWTAEYIAQKYAHHFSGLIINIGGDITVRGRDIKSENFIISITHPITQENIPVNLRNNSLATSGTYKRKWKGNHHIVDTHTYQSAKSDICSASIISPDGAFADAVSTCCIIWGLEKSLVFCIKQNLQYCFISNQGEISSSFL